MEDRDQFRRLRRCVVALVLLATSTLVVLAGTALPASAAPAQAQSPATFGSQTAANTIAATLGSTTTVGNLIIAAYSFEATSGTTTSCTDNASNSYSVAVVKDNGGDQALAICYAVVASAASTTVTVHLPAVIGYRSLAVHEYSGLATSSPLDSPGVVSNNAVATGGASNSVTSTAITASTNNSLVFGAFENESGGTTTVSAGTGFTNRTSVTSAYAAELTTEDQVLASAGSIAATETWAASRSYIAVMAIFKPLSTGASVSLVQSDGSASATGVSDSATVGGVTLSAIKCVKVAFLTAVDGTGVKPTGLVVTSAALNSSSTWPATPASWTVTNDNTAGTVKLTYATGTTPASASGRLLKLDNLTNPSTTTTYYVVLSSFTNTDCVTGPVDVFTTAVAPSSAVALTANVVAALTFSVAGRSSVCNGQSATNFQTGSTGTVVNMGRATASTNGGGAQDLSVTTNAAFGFVVYLRTAGTTPNSLHDSNGHSIADVSGTSASPGSAPSAGTPGFGYTSSGAGTNFTSNTWAKLTNTNDSILVASAGTSSASTCVGYATAVGTTTAPGAYSSTVIYTAVPAF